MNRRQEGFSLAEIVVGLGIGMLSMVVIMQVFAVFEGGKRTTTSGADAQNNGALALYMIEQDARMAGWGMEPATYANCNNVYSYCDGSSTCNGAAGAIAGLTFAPLTLEDGGSEPDTFSSKYFADPKFTAFQLTSKTKLQRTMPQSSSELDVGSVNGCRDGDLMIVSQAGNCTLMQITHIQTTAGKIQHNPGASGPYNPPASYQNANGWPAYTVGAEVSCFPAPDKGALHHRTYSINAATRQLVRTDPERTEVVASEIMDLQIQYGIAPAGGSQVVNEWVDGGGAWSSPTLAEARRVKAIRIALVARSTQYERPEPGTACNTTTPAMVAAWSSWANFSTANYPSDWQCYRYKVFETVVPLRNVLWGNL
ncbi:MAG TPA: PilW family protein [Noviherbaspirillum sp.]|nr:PilW family protein [Noviherbaspirillum sp.]